MNRFFRSALFPLFVIVLLVYLASQTLIPHSKAAVKTTYSQFIGLAAKGEVGNVVFNPGKRQINFTLTADAGKKASVHYPADQSVPLIEDTLIKAHVPFDSKGTG
ncbi:MAG: hypothetical protein QOD43_1319, partial [Gaiellaceae bacterium]|nr:hypothetical protein [Gaiellaceae bacterium]